MTVLRDWWVTSFLCKRLGQTLRTSFKSPKCLHVWVYSLTKQKSTTKRKKTVFLIIPSYSKQQFKDLGWMLCRWEYLKTRAFVHPNPSTRDSVISRLSALISGTSCFKSQATEGVPITCRNKVKYANMDQNTLPVKFLKMISRQNFHVFIWLNIWLV